MKALSLLFVLACLPGAVVAQDPATPATQAPAEQALYKNSEIGIQFNHPKTWIVTTNKKGESRFIIPVPNSSQKAVLELYPVNFRSEKEVWQLSQAGIAKSQKREVERQWEEEILGVPLLLTKLNFTDKGGPEVMLNGLMYTLSTGKMGYRLTATPDDFDRANYEWQQAMLTIRTEDGQMPKPEDPSVTLAPRTKDDLAHPSFRNVISGGRPLAPEKAPLATVIDSANRKVEIHLPEAWKIGEFKDGVATLTNPGMGGPVTMTVMSTLDGDAPGTSLIKASAASLSEFATITTREENFPKNNRAGGSWVLVWRTGTGAAGALITVEAYVQTGDFYTVLTYKSNSPVQATKDRKMIEDLVDRLSLEVQP